MAGGRVSSRLSRVTSRLLAREACGFQKSKNQLILKEDLATWLGRVARLRLVSSLRIAWLLGEALPRVSSPTCMCILRAIQVILG